MNISQQYSWMIEATAVIIVSIISLSFYLVPGIMDHLYDQPSSLFVFLVSIYTLP